MEILFEKTALKNSLTSNSPSILHENKTGGEEGQHRFLFSDLTLVSFFMPLTCGSSLPNASLEVARRQAPRNIVNITEQDAS